MDENAPMPSLGLSLLPVLIPLVLITFGAVAQSYWFTDSSIAISLGAVAAVWVLARQRRQGGESVEAAVQTALMSGATILLITAAGGAFGNSLRQTGVADVIQQLGSEAARNWALPLCFVITALVRTAQGSATVAMITAAPIAAAFLESGDLGFHPVYLALAVGCGSKPIPWLNDSGFWIITRMSGMKEAETLKIVTPMMSLMGLVGLPVVMIGAWLFPMAGS
jgi:GntP family gluconate:H+ symporter